MACSNKTGLVPLRGPSLPLCVIVRIERDPGTRQWPSEDSPSTAVRRCHLAGVYCRNPLDHLPFLNRAIRFGWSASTSHFTACRVPSRTFPRPTADHFPEERFRQEEIWIKSGFFRESDFGRSFESQPNRNGPNSLNLIQKYESGTPNSCLSAFSVLCGDSVVLPQRTPRSLRKEEAE